MSKRKDGNSPFGTFIAESVWPVKRHMELRSGILPEHAAEGSCVSCIGIVRYP